MHISAIFKLYAPSMYWNTAQHSALDRSIESPSRAPSVAQTPMSFCCIFYAFVCCNFACIALKIMENWFSADMTFDWLIICHFGFRIIFTGIVNQNCGWGLEEDWREILSYAPDIKFSNKNVFHNTSLQYVYFLFALWKFLSRIFS